MSNKRLLHLDENLVVYDIGDGWLDIHIRSQARFRIPRQQVLMLLGVLSKYLDNKEVPNAKA